MTRSKHSRRRFLRGVGAAAAALPFLRPTSVFADAPPKRIVFFIVKNGTTLDDFWPSGSDPTSSRILEPLAPFASELSVLRGIDHATARQSPIPPDHQPDFPNLMAATQRGQGGRLAGCSSSNESRCYDWSLEGTTIDQVLADRFRGETLYPSLHFGVLAPRGGANPVSFRSSGEVFWPDNDPFVMHTRLFERFALGEDAFAAVARRRQSILDVVREDVDDVARRLGSEHREGFCAHLNAISELSSTLGATGAACEVPMIGDRFDHSDERNVELTMEAQRRLLAMALRCDLTRVAIFQLTKGDERWSSLGMNLDGGWHAYIHENSHSDRNARQTTISRFFAEQYAALLGELASVPEGDGTLLDNCAVVWMHEQAKTSTHQRTDVPYVLAGRCGGALRPRGLVDLRSGDSGRANNDLLVTLFHAMGDDRSTFGDPAFNTGPISQLLA